MREIAISQLIPANEHGTCNACDAQISENGTLPGAKVYEITLRRVSFRLCQTCAAIVQAGLALRLRGSSAQPDGGAAGVCGTPQGDNMTSWRPMEGAKRKRGKAKID